MSGLHRTVSNIRKAINAWLENPTVARTAALAGMARREATFEQALRAFDSDTQARVRDAVAS